MKRAICTALTAVAALSSVAAAQSVPTRSDTSHDARAAARIAYATAGMPYRAEDVRIIVSVDERRLWVIANDDTVRSAPVSVASGKELNYAGRTWRFDAPRGEHRVRDKRTDPVWMPPDWHYAEVASNHGLQLKRLTASGARLSGGTRIVVRDSIVGVIQPGDTAFLPLPVNEHIVFDSVLYIPPVGTHNRRLEGELGKYALDIGNGFLLHGTPDQSTIGQAVTHGCIRLADEDLEWLYQYVPVGAVVVVR
jgi:lipoprotein-anchoring transpeptidase ErfK/SrfK